MERNEDAESLRLIKEQHATAKHRKPAETVISIAVRYFGYSRSINEVNDCVQEYFDFRAGAPSSSATRRKQNLEAVAKHATAFRTHLVQADWLALRDGFRSLNAVSSANTDTSDTTMQPDATKKTFVEQSYPLTSTLNGLLGLLELTALAATSAARAEKLKQGRPSRPFYLASCIQRLAVLWECERGVAPVFSRKTRLRDGSTPFTEFVVELLLPPDLTENSQKREERMLRSAVREILEEAGTR